MLIGEGERDGAKLLLDGRNCKIEGLEGHFVGPTLIDDATTEMSIYQQEIFGPVLVLLHAPRALRHCYTAASRRYRKTPCN